MKREFALILTVILLATGCANRSQKAGDEMRDTSPATFHPWEIADSSAIRRYPNGLGLYMVQEGPGAFPRDGMNIRMDYHAMLEDGSVFDSTFEREEPFAFTLGQTAVIPGIEEAIRKMRLGSKAVVFIPPALGYGDQEDRPSNIPPASTLIFHVDLLGTF